MNTTTDRYINLFTDYGLKKLFGEDLNKDLSIAFLNDLLQKEDEIKELSYLKNEQLGRNEGERRAVYDLYCTNEKGEKKSYSKSSIRLKLKQSECATAQNLPFLLYRAPLGPSIRHS